MATFPTIDYVFKVVMVGDPCVGKSCLARRFADDLFCEEALATVGAAFHSRLLRIDGKCIKLQLWDVAGQERYRSVAPLYYRLANGVVVVYDATDTRSFEHVPFWLEQSERHREDGAQLLLLGNKCDCARARRRVDPREAALLADARGLPFFETSAKDGTNVHAAFCQLLRAITRAAEAAAADWMGDAERAVELDRTPPAEPASSCC